MKPELSRISVLRVVSSIALLIYLVVQGGLASEVVESLPLRQGDFLLEEYIRALKSERSPKKASKTTAASNDIARIEVREERGLDMVIFHGGVTHEIAGQILIDKNGNVTKRHLYGYEKAKFVVRSDASLVIERNGRRSEYSWVGSLDQFVNANSVAGIYEDAEGKRYVFTDKGRAIFPDRSFDYGIAVDFTSLSYDLLVEKRQNSAKEKGSVDEELSAYTFFANDGDELYLYHLDKNSGWYTPEAEPFLVLKRVKQ